MGVAALWMVGVVAANTATVDWSSRRPDVSGYPVATGGAAVCAPEVEEDVRAVAIVTYGRRPGRSAWGHTSLRFLVCRSGVLDDVEYEYYRMDGSIRRFFAGLYPGEAWVEDDVYQGKIAGSLVLVYNPRPVDGGFYGLELDRNREIIEAWMPWGATLRRTLLHALEARYAEQLEDMRARSVLDGYRYRPMGTNCTLHIREALALAAGEEGWAGSVFPFVNLRALERDPAGAVFVIHPSTHAVARHGVVAEMPLVRPVLLARRWWLSDEQKDAMEVVLVRSGSVVVDWLAAGWEPGDSVP